MIHSLVCVIDMHFACRKQCSTTQSVTHKQQQVCLVVGWLWLFTSFLSCCSSHHQCFNQPHQNNQPTSLDAHHNHQQHHCCRDCAQHQHMVVQLSMLTSCLLLFIPNITNKHKQTPTNTSTNKHSAMTVNTKQQPHGHPTTTVMIVPICQTSTKQQQHANNHNWLTRSMC